MKNLFLFDTETLKQQQIAKDIKKHNIFNAKYGGLCMILLSAMFVVGIVIFTISINSLKFSHSKEIAEMQYTCDSIETKEEIDELRYLIGYLYLQTQHDKPNKDTVYKFIISCNTWYPEYIMAQAVLESSCGNSDVGVNANNLFGMKYIDQSRPHRPTTQIPGIDYKGYGVYASWELSVVDRIQWELTKYKNVKPNIETYRNGFSTYAENESYIEIVTGIANKYKNKK